MKKIKNHPKRNSKEYLEQQLKKTKERQKKIEQKIRMKKKKGKRSNETAYAFSFCRFFITKYLTPNGMTLQDILNGAFDDPDFMINFLLENKKNNHAWREFMNYLNEDDLKKFGFYNAFHNLKYNTDTNKFER